MSDRTDGNAPTSSSVMLLTPPPPTGGSAIAVVRVRGPLVARFLSRHFSRPAAPGRCNRGEIRDGSQVIDDAVVVADAAASWADLCLHGGSRVIECVMDLARREGFTSEPGEIPIHGQFLDEASSEIEREVMQYLPLALTETALRLLLNQPRAWGEAGPGTAGSRSGEEDFDVAAIARDQTLKRLLHPATVAIIGEPNVGKSTLANQLFGAARSITADVPGITRDWVGEMANLGGLAVHLIDTPGFRESGDAIEQSAIAAGAAKIREADVLVVVLDATRQSAPVATPPRKLCLTVVNKSDLPAAWSYGDLRAIKISAKTGAGMRELVAKIHEFLGVNVRDLERRCWWTERQMLLLRDHLDDPTASLQKLTRAFVSKQ